MNNKKEGDYYSQMVRRYKNEYGGENLQEFCIKEKVSYTKMLHCLRNESYRRPQPQAEAQVEDPGLRPLVVDSPMQEDLPPEEIKRRRNDGRTTDIMIAMSTRLNELLLDENAHLGDMMQKALRYLNTFWKQLFTFSFNQTFIATCQMMGMSVLKYFKSLFSAIAKGRTDYENMLPMTIGLCKAV